MKRVFTKAFCGLLAVALILGSIPLSGHIGIGSIFMSQAEATSTNYIIVRSPNDLDNIRNNLSGSYILANDIDMSKIDNWQPIGNDESPFTGVLNGNGYSIKNLTVNLTSNTPNGETAVNAGLIGVSKNATIQNLGVENSNVSHTQTGSVTDTASYCNASGIVGVAYNSTIEKCFFTGSISSTATQYAFSRSSGIALCDGTTIRNCYVDADISAKGYTANTMCGGIAAWNANSVVDKCYATGTIYAESTRSYVYLGGIVGSGSGTVSNSVVLFNSFKYSGESKYYSLDLVDTVCAFSTLNNNKALSSIISSIPNESATSISVSSAKSSSTYTAIGWDFDSVWNVDDGYPKLITNNEGYKDKFNDIEKIENAKFIINVSAYEATTNKLTGVNGAEVSIYLGRKRVAKTYSQNGVAIFTNNDIKTTIEPDFLF